MAVGTFGPLFASRLPHFIQEAVAQGRTADAASLTALHSTLVAQGADEARPRSLLGDLIQVASFAATVATAGAAAPILGFETAALPTIAEQAAQSLVAPPEPILTSQPPSDPDGLLPALTTMFLQALAPEPARPLAGLAEGAPALVQAFLSREGALLDTVLPPLLQPLTASTLAEVRELATLQQFVTGPLTVLADELAAGTRDVRNILLPGVSLGAGALFQIVAALIRGEAPDPNSILGLGREVLVLLARTLGPEARFWIPAVTRLLTVLLPRREARRDRLLGFVDAMSDELPDSVSFAFTGVEGLEVGGGAGALAGFVRMIVLTIAALGRDVIQVVGAATAELREPIAVAGAPLGHLAFEAMDLLHLPMEAVMEKGGEVLFDRIRDRLERFGPIDPDNVDAAGARVLATAGALGMSAHLVALLAESVAFFKHLGIPQMAAFLSDLANFAPLGRVLIGSQFEAALRSPAMRRARATHRPELPDPVSHEIHFLRRKLDEESFKQYYREQGWSEERVQMQALTVFRKPTPRDLAFVFEDAEVDPAVIGVLLQEMGFSDEDAELMNRGLTIRATRKFRDRLFESVVKALEEGLLDDARAEELLAPLRIRQETMQLLKTAVNVTRTRDEVTKQAKLLEDSAAAAALTPEDLEVELAALGFDERARVQAARRARLRLGIKSFTEERAELRATVRRVQTTQVEAALRLHRDFLLDDGELGAMLPSFGVQPEEVAALVQLASAKRQAVPKLETVLSPAALLQAKLQARQDEILALQRNGIIDEVTATTLLQLTGVEPERAVLDARLVAARRTHPSKPTKPAREPAATRLTRELHTDAAVRRFRDRLSTDGELRGALQAAGQPPDVVDALVAREVERREAAALRHEAHQAELQLTRDRKDRERAALDAFRRGDLDPVGLTQTLVALGRPPDAALALTERELARLAAKPPTTSA